MIAFLNDRSESMDRDPYQPPSSPVSDPVRPPARPGSLWKGLAAGTVIEVVGTLIAGLLVATIYGAVLGASGLSVQQIEAEITNMDPLSAVGLMSGALGSFVSIFAGYAAAALARRSDYLAVAAMCAISVGLGFAFGITELGLTTLLVMTTLTIAAVFFGGWLHMKDQRRG
jgi:hypothetical protein